jgi:acetyltransferase-like isoleucine patch superfamily enzyme
VAWLDVDKNVPDNTIVGGIPAKFIRINYQQFKKNEKTSILIL